MGKYRVIEEWTNYRIVEVEASSEDEAVDLVQDGQGNEVDGGTDNHSTEARLIEGDTIAAVRILGQTVVEFGLPSDIAGYLEQLPQGGY